MRKILLYSLCASLVFLCPAHATSMWKCALKTTEGGANSKNGGTLEVRARTIVANFDEFGRTGQRYVILRNTKTELVAASYDGAASQSRKQLSALVLDKHSGELQLVSMFFQSKYQEAWNATCAKN